MAFSPRHIIHWAESAGAGDLDLILSDPALYVAEEVEHGARALLSTARMWNNKAYDQTGTLVFVRSDSTIRRFEDLKNRRVMAVDRTDFSGWWLAEQEFRKHRLEPGSLFSSLVFSGGNEREVIYAVQAGLVDAGVVRAGVLESLAMRDVIKLEDFAPVSALTHAEFPFWVSTPLFPEWVLSAMPDVPEPALALIINTLLSVTPDSAEAKAANETVWQAPLNYQEVHDLLISLRVRPYESYLLQAASRIYDAYRWPILGVAAIILASLAFLTYELRRNMQLAEERRNVLQSEVRSKKFYRSAIEEHTVFCMLTREGMISHVNNRFVQLTDRTRQSLVNSHLTELLTDADEKLLSEEITSSMEVGVPWTGPLKIRKEDGSYAWDAVQLYPGLEHVEQAERSGDRGLGRDQDAAGGFGRAVQRHARAYPGPGGRVPARDIRDPALQPGGRTEG